MKIANCRTSIFLKKRKKSRVCKLFVHTMPTHLKTLKDVTDKRPVHTKTANFLLVDFKIVGFANGTLTGHIFETVSCEHPEMK